MNKNTNCVTTYFNECETQLEKAPRQGLLYGIPVSLKECINCKVTALACLCPSGWVSLAPTDHHCSPLLLGP